MTVIGIFGPTASGKSKVAAEVAGRIPAELVSADALQVYRGLPILTNQPSEPTRMVGIWPLDRETSVGEYAPLAHAAVDEILAHAYWRERGTEAIVVRLFNCVGPRQTGTYGMVLPSLVRRALAGEDLTVYGTGEQRRSFCHVLDTVAAIVALLDHPDSPGEPFNIGAHNEVTINDLARLVVDRTRSTSAITHIPYEIAYEEGFEDMERRVPDTTKLERLTGWAPKRSLDEILDDVIAFERAQLATGA